jgi:hypothetical protein
LGEFFGRLVTEKALLYRVSHALEDRKNQVLGQLAAPDSDPNRLMAGTALWIIDITGHVVAGGLERFLASAWESRGPQFLAHLDSILRREAALALAQSYEAFETFVKDTAAAYLVRHPESLSQAAWRTSAARRAKAPKNGALDAWRTYVRQTYVNDFESLLKRLRLSCQRFSDAERSNQLGADFAEWFRAVTEVRHAATHTNGVIKRDRLARLSPAARRHLAVYLEGQVTTAQAHLTVTRELAMRTIEYIAAYGFQLFKTLSITDGHAWTPPRRGVK